MAGEKQGSQLLITESKQDIKRKKKDKEKKQTEKCMNQEKKVQTVCLWFPQANKGLSTVQVTCTEISVSYRSIYWLKVDH